MARYSVFKYYLGMTSVTPKCYFRIWFLLVYLKCTSSHLGFCIFAMFSTFRDAMQYIVLGKNFIFMVFLAVRDAGTDVI